MRFGAERWVVPAAVLLAAQFIAGLALSNYLGFYRHWLFTSYHIVGLVIAAALGLAWFLRFLWRSFAHSRNAFQAIRECAPLALPKWLLIALGFQLVAFQYGLLSWLKSMLPMAVPYWADPMLADFDKLIFFGVDPFVIAHWLPLWLIDPIYGTWGMVQGALLVLILAQPASDGKARVMLTYFLTIGLFAVTSQFLLSSGGPIFFERLGYGDRFADLPRAPLNHAAADYLWDSYSTRLATFGSGISAWPSVHVAVAAWMVFVAKGLCPRLIRVAIVYWLIIMIGSVALGWHYITDGVAGTAMAIASWKLSERILGTSPAQSKMSIGSDEPLNPVATPAS